MTGSKIPSYLEIAEIASDDRVSASTAASASFSAVSNALANGFARNDARTARFSPRAVNSCLQLAWSGRLSALFSSEISSLVCLVNAYGPNCAPASPRAHSWTSSNAYLTDNSPSARDTIALKPFYAAWNCLSSKQYSCTAYITTLPDNIFGKAVSLKSSLP